jgi:hypothetical protein
MPDGGIRLIGYSRQALGRRLAELRQHRTDTARTTTVMWQPGMSFPDGAPRPTRQEVFGAGDEPLPGWSSPAARHTGWQNGH